MSTQRLVGSHISDSLETEGCLRALNAALSSLPEGTYPIHHSDRGCQYCSHLLATPASVHERLAA